MTEPGPAEPAVRPESVVVVFPVCESLAGMGQRTEQRLVQKFITEAAVEALNEGILRRLSWRDVVPCHAAILRPLEHSHAGEFGRA